MGIIMSTSNCVGGVCLDLNDVFNFITKIKTLDLYGYAHPRKCCADGTQIDPSCGSCDDSQRLNGIKREDACIFSYCFSWSELYAKLGELKTTYDAAVKSEYWKKTGTIAPYVGANYLRYGGN